MDNELSPFKYFYGLKFAHYICKSTVYSSPPLIGTPFLSNNSVHIREVSFTERED